ncbi:MAG: VWA domain-containing protein [Gemmataceae bacterium]
MRPRRTTPSLVSMWMLDVFCCALGCVTLLWLLNTREAKQESMRAAAALTDLASSRDNLAAAKADADATRRMLNAQIDELRGKLVATTNERDETAKLLASVKADLTEQEKKLSSATVKIEERDDLLARKQKQAAELAAKLASAQVSADELVKLLRLSEKEREALLAKSAKLDQQLNDTDARLRSTLAEMKDAKNALSTMKKSGDELASAAATIRDLKNQLDQSNTQIIDLQGDKKKLADKFDKLRVETDSKFAGIAMTGKRVVFLVDISGSMKLLDEKTPDASKWPTVVETVSKVMRSIPDIEAYQVIIFSRTADYLFPGGFITYKGEESIRKVTDALKVVEPVGDTNLHAGLDLAFRLRSTGLDTIYLFSDGLPTSGPGITPEQERLKLNDVQRGELLGKYIRDTLRREWNLTTSRGQRVRINAVGFYYESPDVGAFLWSLARENDGSFVGMSRP